MIYAIRYVLYATIIILLLLAGCTGNARVETGTEEVSKMDIAGKNILLVVAPNGYRDEEFREPKEVFDEAGATVTVASKGVKTAKGKLGDTVKVDMDISDVVAFDYDAVVFVGGPGTTVYFDDPVAQKIAKDAVEAGRVVGAICIAPSILANAGVLEGKKATSFESEKANIEPKCQEYTGDDVTVDGKIVTANGPEAATDFGHAVAGLLE